MIVLLKMGHKNGLLQAILAASKWYALPGRLVLYHAVLAGGVGWTVNARQGEALSRAQQVRTPWQLIPRLQG